MIFYICKGAPSYNSGSFADTLCLDYSTAVYKAENCTTFFIFGKKGVTVKWAEDNKACLGSGAYAHGYYRKESSKEPELVDALSETPLSH